MAELVKDHDVLIIGSGAAGLTAALSLAESRKVLVLAKGKLTSGSTAWAQGGIAAVLDAGDTFDDHNRDTMVAGAGLNDLATVEFVIEGAPAAIDRLCELGVPFNREGDDLHLTREGGHSHRRIVHVHDATGWAVQAALLKAAEEQFEHSAILGEVALAESANPVTFGNAVDLLLDRGILAPAPAASGGRERRRKRRDRREGRDKRYVRGPAFADLPVLTRRLASALSAR